jgi:acyl-CoA synthetase (AMP-forming)/AMP-acid ligase II
LKAHRLRLADIEQAVNCVSGGATIVGCGNVEEAATLGIDIVIVDPDTHELRPDGTVGEIWVRWVFVSAPSRFRLWL